MNNRITNQKEETNQLTRRLSPITKLSTPSRPFSRVKSVTGQRKKPWNKRFIYSKIPDYYSIKDKNVINAKKLRMYSVKKKNVFDANYITYQQSKMKQMKTNPVKPFNRTMSGFFSHYSRGTTNEFTTKRNIISPLTNTAFNRNTLMKNSNINLNININLNDENFNKIKTLWNELCVFPSYRELYIIIYNQLSGEEKEQLFKKELNELITVKSDIKTLVYYIEQRSIILKDLYEENIKLNRSKNDKNDDILIEISNLIEKLRESTIDVCYAMKKLKNDITNVNNLLKYNFDLLANKSKFDKNYLIKMKSELSFLKEGNAKFYFNLNDDRTPFLLKASEANINLINNLNANNMNMNDKEFFLRIVPLKEEIKEHINECNFYIYQELIAYQQNIMNQKKIFRCVSPLKTKFFVDNKDNDISGINKNYGVNESLAPKKMNKNIYNDFSDINSVISSNNIFGEKTLKNVQNIINQRLSARKNKDLFSQKLLSGYIPGIPSDIDNNLLMEDEKVKDEEEEEEEEEKSEKDTSKNELNDLIEEKKDETENYENSKTKTNINAEDKKSLTNKKYSNSNTNIKNKEEEIISNKNISNDSSKKSNAIASKENDNIDNNLNKDINQYLNNESNDYVNIENNNKDEQNDKDNKDEKEEKDENNNKDSKSNNEKNTVSNDKNQKENNEENNNIEKTVSNKDDKNNNENKEEIISNKEETKNKNIEENTKTEDNKNNNIDNKNNNEKESEKM